MGVQVLINKNKHFFKKKPLEILGNFGKKVFISIIILVILFFLFNFAALLLLNIFPDFFNGIDYKSIPPTLISISFTLLGFGLTLRNLLLGRDNQMYTGFSMKSLITAGTPIYSKICWYLVIAIPLSSIVLYFFGYRRQLYFYTLLSAICMVIYFVNVLRLLKKETYQKTISYIVIDQIYDLQNEYINQHRDEFFNKLFKDKNDIPEAIIIFGLLINSFAEVVTKNDNYIFQRFRKYFARTTIQRKLRKQLKSKQYNCDEIVIKSFSLYSYEFFFRMLKNSDNNDKSINQCIDMIKTFIIEQKVRIDLLSNSKVIINLTKDIVNLDNYKTNTSISNGKKHEMKHKNENKYYLLFNLLLGMFSAGISLLSLSEFQQLYNGIIQRCIKNSTILSKSKISAIVVVIILYDEISDIKLKKISYKELFYLYNEMIDDTSDIDFLFLEEFLSGDFYINTERIKLKDSFNTLKEKNTDGTKTILFL